MKLRYFTSYIEGRSITAATAAMVAAIVFSMIFITIETDLIWALVIVVAYAALAVATLFIQQWQIVDSYRLEKDESKGGKQMERENLQTKIQKLKEDIISLPRKLQALHADIVRKENEIRRMRSERISSILSNDTDVMRFLKRERKVRSLLQDIRNLRATERSYRSRLDQEKTDLRLAVRFQRAAEQGDKSAQHQVHNILKRYA